MQFLEKFARTPYTSSEEYSQCDGMASSSEEITYKSEVWIGKLMYTSVRSFLWKSNHLFEEKKSCLVMSQVKLQIIGEATKLCDSRRN